jgi:putative ABC transport system ATP-binding protein
MSLLDQINAQGLTLVLITHDARLAEAMPRRITLHDGRVTSDTSRTPATQLAGLSLASAVA